MKFRILILLLCFSNTLYAGDGKVITVSDICIAGPDSVVVIKDAVDFIIVDISWGKETLRAYFGNHPKTPEDYQFPDKKEFIIHIGDDVYVRYDLEFPKYLHVMDVKNVSLIVQIRQLNIVKECI